MDAINRLTETVGKRCFYCKNTCRKTCLTSKDVKLVSEQYYVITVKSYKVDDVKLNDLHLLCKKCREKLKKQYDNVDESKKNVNYVELYCSLCDMAHQIDNDIMKNILQDGCVCSCLIF